MTTFDPTHSFMVPVSHTKVNYAREIAEAASTNSAHPFAVGSGLIEWVAPLGAAGAMLQARLCYNTTHQASVAMAEAMTKGTRLVVTPLVETQGRAEVPIDEMWPAYVVEARDGFLSKFQATVAGAQLFQMLRTGTGRVDPDTGTLQPLEARAGVTLVLYTPRRTHPFPGHPWVHTERGGWKLQLKSQEEVQVAPTGVNHSMLWNSVAEEYFPHNCPALDTLAEGCKEVMSAFGYTYDKPRMRRRRGIQL